MAKKFAIFGPYPPPIGGISVHIQRIANYLKQMQMPFTIFNYGFGGGENVVATNKSPIFYLKFLYNRQFEFIHFHNNILLEFIYYYVFSKINSTPIIVTIHAESLIHLSKFKQSFLLYFIIHSKKIKFISVSETIYDLLKSKNLDVDFLPAYVPPISLSKQTLSKDHRVHFLFSVWRLTEMEAKNVYNVPLIFEFLKANQADFKMVFMIGSQKSSDLNYLTQLIKDYGVESSIEVIFDQNIVDFVQNCQFLIRTNIADAYGISLQEAMDLGVPAIGSNVCTRPKGTVIFESENLADMSEKINFVVNSDKNELLSHKESLTYHLDLIDYYQSLLK